MAFGGKAGNSEETLPRNARITFHRGCGHTMRRLFASLALAAILGVFVLPLAASMRRPEVPLCCLPGGKHHCTQHPAGTGTGFKGKTDACPYLSHFIATSVTGLQHEKFEIDCPGASDFIPPTLALADHRSVARQLSDRGPPAPSL